MWLPNEKFAWDKKDITPGAEAPRLWLVERPKAEALGYLEEMAKSKAKSNGSGKGQSEGQRQEPQQRHEQQQREEQQQRQEADPYWMTNEKDNSNSKGKYSDLFTAHWTVKLSRASVEMAFVFDGLDGRTSNDGDATAKGKGKRQRQRQRQKQIPTG